MLSIIDDPNLANLIQEYNRIDINKLKEILSDIDHFQLRQILFESNPKVLANCDVCRTTDESKYCSKCNITICFRNHKMGIVKCITCQKYFCTDCLQLIQTPSDDYFYKCFDCFFQSNQNSSNQN